MLFSMQVLPAARQAARNLEQRHAVGGASLGQMINAQRTVLAVRRTIAEARIGREKFRADLEAVVAKQ
jgi:outer membrane protein TolC